jgi:ubiquinone/menaquinone biosynthesis C-methylase UbiE
VLTVRYPLLGLGADDRLLDLGTGGGRHAFEAMRRGAFVTALDADRVEVGEATAMMHAMTVEDAATKASGGDGAGVCGDALRLPFAAATFDRVIAAEVLEHIPDDQTALFELARVLRPGGTMAVTVPRWFPEHVNWALSDEYHNTPGGHIRIYRRSELVRRLERAGLFPYAGHHAHALHSPYWWLKCAVGVHNDTHPAVRNYHRLLVWDITAGHPLTRIPEAVLNPILGKSVVVYSKKSA